jgi:hypothetical protein
MGSLHRFDQLLELPKQSHPDHSANTKQKASLPTGAFVVLPLALRAAPSRNAMATAQQQPKSYAQDKHGEK